MIKLKKKDLEKKTSAFLTINLFSTIVVSLHYQTIPAGRLGALGQRAIKWFYWGRSSSNFQLHRADVLCCSESPVHLCVCV